ncbi:poly-specific ribonuclease (deadenylation nuclease) [Stylonychia lemnae]|uniref:Poly-specific ribonuclease (Deadenylation nuclease) n=1 Tax=Stylonychia lemnae TaxID=5949 RepID=A0A078B910_STYLE|nr:poly-specific ribonuclease (deadenylation nuclease) [Stylonychia lemnae]|eukprot:CDW90995.1 poly-specific ribonuclease (deadenylation nuclease) [Stylonychia lemnae]
MNITRYNFKKQLPSIIKCLNQSDFIAIDFEFSGLNFDKELENLQSDTVAQRYWKSKENVSKFMAPQMGICAFKYHQNEKRLECHPFNFYIMPHSYQDLSIGHNYLIEQSAFQFLMQHGFDFNKLHYESMGYLSYQDYQKYLTIKADKEQTKQIYDYQYDSPDCIIFCNSQFQAIKNWLDAIGSKIVDLENDPANLLEIDLSFSRGKQFKSLMKNIPKMFPKYQLDIELSMDETIGEILLKIKITSQDLQDKKAKLKERETNFALLSKYLFCQQITQQITIKQALNGLLTTDQQIQMESLIQKYRKILQDKQEGQLKSVDWKQEDEDAVIKKMLKDFYTESALLDTVANDIFNQVHNPIEDPLGLSILPLYIAKLQKPIVQYNGMLDLLHLYDKFIGKLPDTTLEFTSTMNALYPHIFDNKLIMNNNKSIQESMAANYGYSLQASYKRVIKDDFKFGQTIQINSDFNDYDIDSDLNHEAGFDAFQTGVVFFKMLSYIKGQKANQKCDFPFMSEILNDNSMNLDKNKVPFYNLKKNMLLEKQNSQDDDRNYVFVIDSLLNSQKIDQAALQQYLNKLFGSEVTLYMDEADAQGQRRQLIFMTLFSKQAEIKANDLLSKNGFIEIEEILPGSKIIGYSHYENQLRQKKQVEVQSMLKELEGKWSAFENLQESNRN